MVKRGWVTILPKLYEIRTRMSGFGRPIIWKPDHVKSDLKKVQISNCQISDPQCSYLNNVDDTGTNMCDSVPKMKSILQKLRLITNFVFWPRVFFCRIEPKIITSQKNVLLFSIKKRAKSQKHFHKEHCVKGFWVVNDI